MLLNGIMLLTSHKREGGINQPIFQKRKQKLGGVDNLPQVAQVLKVGAGILTQACALSNTSVVSESGVLIRSPGRICLS